MSTESDHHKPPQRDGGAPRSESRQRPWTGRVKLHAARVGLRAYLTVLAQQDRGWGVRLPGRKITFFHQLDDIYSQLLAQVLPEVGARYGVDIGLVIVPAPEADVDPAPQLRQTYALRDAVRLSRYYQLEVPRSAPDAPLRQPDAASVTRAQAILLGARTGQLSLAATVGHALWTGDRAALDALADAHGVANVSTLNHALAENARRLRALGHYQGGMIHHRDAAGSSWYWGIDRLYHLEDRLRSDGARAAAARGAAPADQYQPYVVRMRPEQPAPHPRDRAQATITCYFSVRSPYSYIAMERLARVSADTGAALDVRPVLPMVMRGLPVPPAKRIYIARDAWREAARHGAAFGNLVDPLGHGVERAMAALYVALGQGRGAALALSVGRAVWAEGRDLTRDRDLVPVVMRAGLDWAQVSEAVYATDAAGPDTLADDNADAVLPWRLMAERHQSELRDLGFWGVPVLCLGDVAVWGQDRIPIIDRMIREGHEA